MEIAARDIQYLLKGTELLVQGCEKCVDIRGDNTEIQQNCFTLKGWSGQKFRTVSCMCMTGQPAAPCM
jgi:hypothetical protein